MDNPPPPPPAATATAGLANEQALTQQLNGGSSWFFWIAGGSIVNTVIAMSKGQVSLIVGLGITQVVDGLLMSVAKAENAPSPMLINAIGLVIALLIAGFFVGFGILGNKKQTWAIILGMVLYAIDGLIFVLVQDWLSLGFHAFALYRINMALQACMALNKK